MDNLSFGKIAKLLVNNAKNILLFTILGLIIGVVYATMVYSPVYKSTAKVMLKNSKQSTVVTELATNSGISTLTDDANPTLNQIEIIKSNRMAEYVWSKISEKYNFKEDSQKGIKMIQKAMSVDNPAGTDLLEITAGWNNPEVAKDIATVYVEAYIGQDIDNAKRGVLFSKNSIAAQLNEADKSLKKVREDIKTFRRQFSTVNIEAETENMVSQLSNLENRYLETTASARGEASKAGTISNSLGMKWNDAIKAVAIGSNGNISTLEAKLNETNEELASLKTKYTQEHPSVIALNARKHQIEVSISDQINKTIGENIDNQQAGVINDPVRTAMMEQLATTKADQSALASQSGALRSAIRSLEIKKSVIPIKQQVLANMLQQEGSLADLVNTLKSKLTEATIRESEIVSNISVTDLPLASLYPAFPSRIHLSLVFAVFGALIGIISVMTAYFIKDTYDDVDEVENDLKTPVLGVIPWLNQAAYNSETFCAVDESSSFYSLAYQKIVSGLRIKGHNSGAKILGFTSTQFSKERSSVLANVAYSLSKTGQSVIIIDADFRTPSIHKEFGVNVHPRFNLPELLTSISKEVKENGEFNANYLNYYIQHVDDSNNLGIIPNSGNVSDVNEFLHSSSFTILIKMLKERYDWVLLDTPPALAVPDAVTTGSLVDGILIVTGLNTTKSTIKRIHKLFANYNIPLFGIIARNIETKEAVSSNEYLKQIISRMMTQEQRVVAEE